VEIEQETKATLEHAHERGNIMDEVTPVSPGEGQLTNWSLIRRATGIGGTYLFGSLERLGVDEEWLRKFYAQACGQGCRARVHEGHLYIDVLCR
jgi:hypothetical protein